MRPQLSTCPPKPCLAGRLGEGGWSIASGVTMIELLVAVAILTMIMLSFSMIMTQVQETVSVGQKTIRTNAAAGAIIDTIRNDIRRAGQTGFICITQAPDRTPCLIFTTAGITPSKTSKIIGTAGLTFFGHCANHSSSPPFNPCIFYSQGWVLFPGPPEQDVLGGYDLAHIQRFPRYLAEAPETYPNDLNDLISQLFVRGFGPPQSIAIPLGASGNLGDLWQVLAENCQALSVMWTEGVAGPFGLTWYGIDYTIDDNDTPRKYDDDTIECVIRGKPDPDEDSWMGRGPDATDGSGAYYAQFNADGLDYYGAYDGDAYRALWTHHNQDNWPRAIKIRFELVEGEERNTYEVICPVGG